VLLLGQTGSEDAVRAAVHAQLKDAESIVRAAAANALGELRLESATTCLKSALGESDASVRAAMEKALATPSSLQKGALYLNIEPISGGLDTNLVTAR
jgi:HEAT repeat protein